MGPENSKAGDLDLYTSDGEKIWKIQDFSEVTVPSGKEAASAISRVMAPFSMTISVKPARDWRCRSRKRFIKLLMSKGISRKYAEKVARVARIAGVSYRELWQSWFFWAKNL